MDFSVDDFVGASDAVVVDAVDGLVLASLSVTVDGVPGGAAVVVVSIDTDTSGSVVVVGACLLVVVGLVTGTADDEEPEGVLETAGAEEEEGVVEVASVPEVGRGVVTAGLEVEVAADMVDGVPAVDMGVALVGSVVDWSLPSSGASVSVVTESARGLPVEEGDLLNCLVELAVVATEVAAEETD